MSIFPTTGVAASLAGRFATCAPTPTREQGVHALFPSISGWWGTGFMAERANWAGGSGDRGVARRKVLVLFGTRPEVIKLAPVIKELEANGATFQVVNVSSGQHTDLLRP